MSIEIFCQTHPANDSLKYMMQRKKDERGLTRSLVAILAEDLAEAGGEGLRQLTKRPNQSDATLAPDSKSFTDLSLTDRKAMNANEGAVLLGSSVIAIEGMCITHELDIGSWCTRYNLAISGTPLVTASYEGADSEELTDEGWVKILREVKEDKTFAIFFDTGFNTLPGRMQLFLSQGQRLDAIRQIIPLYQERAQLLVPKL